MAKVTLLLEFLTALLAAFGLMCLVWLGLGRLLRPAGDCPTRMVVAARGAGEGLEQTVKALLWLRRSGLWRGGLVIEDCGLDEGGAALARALAEESGASFSGDAPDRI